MAYQGQEKTGYAPLLPDQELRNVGQGEALPSYPYPVQQQTAQHDTTVVVQQQPSYPTYTVGAVSPPYELGPSNLVLPWVATCFVFMICTWCSLPCTVTAIVLSIYAHIAARRGDVDIAKKTEKISVGLTITGLVTAVFVYVIYIIIYFTGDGDDEDDKDDDDEDDD